MFTKAYFQEIQEGFHRQIRLLDERIAALSLKNETAVLSPFAASAIPDQPASGAASAKMRTLLIHKKEEILNTIAGLPADEAEALIFLYSAMPLSDLLDYPVSLFQSYAKHGAWLYAHGPFAGKVPERLFANYVLHHRINNEDIVDNRSFFYEQLQKTLDTDKKTGIRMYDAAVETNYWCAAQATYHASDDRTENPLTMYKSGTGRCGEESTFGVSALRSIGIPARQVYVPLWSHCDDNHAWVEVWCDTPDHAAHSEIASRPDQTGEWYFLGACEPEERLNFGWFTGPASRAMLLHSRWFGQDAPFEPIISQKGMARMLNHLSRYAYTTELTVKTEDEDGNPVPGAKVQFHVLNEGNYGIVAELTAGSGTAAQSCVTDCGLVHLTTGCGDLYVTASKDGAFGDRHIRLDSENPSETVYTITLQKAPSCSDTWQNVDFHAPSPVILHDEALTDEQKAISAARLAEAAATRKTRFNATWQEEHIARVLAHFPAPDVKKLTEILHKAKGNLPQLLKFLEWDAHALIPAGWEAGRREHWKLSLLQSLHEKDYKDTTAEVLIDCCVSALPYAGTTGVPSDEIFFRFLANPRVENEMLRPCRQMLTDFFREEADALKRDPQKLPAFIKSLITPIPGEEYERLVTSPAGCLCGGIASKLSIDVLCVTLYRCLGIPARLNTLDHSLQYYRNGKFITVSEEGPANAVLRLTGDDLLRLSDREHYSVSRYQNGEFVRLFLSDSPIDAKNNEMILEVKPGIWRVLTTNRLPNGNQLAKQLVFSLKAGEERNVALSLRTPSLEKNLINRPVKELYFGIADPSAVNHAVPGNAQYEPEAAGGSFDKRVSLTQLMEGDLDKALFLWPDVGREPTEHILNELCDRRDSYAALTSPLYIVLNKTEDLADPTLQRTIRALPCLKPILGLSKDDLRTLAPEVGQEPDSLPLIMVMQKGNTCIYSSCGYNVGITDLLLQILRGQSASHS